LIDLLIIDRSIDGLIVEEKKLDILINNAGATFIPERKTVDGFESIFATNHLGTRKYISVNSFSFSYCL